jgi:hypothetical protein
MLLTHSPVKVDRCNFKDDESMDIYFCLALIANQNRAREHDLSSRKGYLHRFQLPDQINYIPKLGDLWGRER